MTPQAAVRPAQPGDEAEWLRLRLALWPDASPAEQAEEIGRFLRKELT